jgi:hypothetical protein
MKFDERHFNELYDCWLFVIWRRADLGVSHGAGDKRFVEKLKQFKKDGRLTSTECDASR